MAKKHLIMGLAITDTWGYVHQPITARVETT